MDHVTRNPSPERLLADFRAAGLEVAPGIDAGELRIIGDEAIFARYRETIRANKAAILEHFRRREQAAAPPPFCAGVFCGWYEASRNLCAWRSPDGRNWVNARPQGLRFCPARPSANRERWKR